MQAWGTLLSGIGTLVMGIGAVIAAWKADTVLDKIAEVKTIIVEIKTISNAIFNQITQLSKESAPSVTIQGLSDFSKKVKDGAVYDFHDNQKLEKQTTSEGRKPENGERDAERLDKNLKENFSKETSDKRPWGLYLKDEKRKEIVEEYKNKKLNLEQLQEKVSEALDSTVLEELRQNRTR